MSNDDGFTHLYFKNLYFNVNGYQTQGINLLSMDMIKKTDAFLFKYDKENKLREVSFVIKGRIEDSYTYGFAKQIYRHTDSSIIFSQYDKFGKPLPMSRPDGLNTIFAKEIVFKNEVPSYQRGLDINGKPLLGFIQKKYECDSLGRIVWESNVDEFGQKMDITRGAGVYYRKFQYTEEGYLLSNSFYEIKDQPRALGGIHLVGYTYNAKGNIVKNAFYNEDLVLTSQMGSGVAYRLMKYNKWGNMTEQAFYDVSDKPRLGEKGFHIQKSSFDKFSNNTKSAYFGLDGTPIINKEIGAFAEKLTYDDRGDLVMSEFLDQEGNLMLSDVLGYSYKALEYNEQGLITSEAYFGVDNQPIQFKGLGAHAKISQYDSLGRLSKTQFLNTDNQSFLHPACGCAYISFEHDSLGQVVEERYLNLAGELTTKSPKNVAKRSYTYDEIGSLKLIEYYDANGNEIVIEGNRPSIQ